MIRVRFAPSPTGHLFVGSARVALANYLFARRNQGEMLLRLDDLDTERCSPAHADAIIQDLGWFGIGWHSSFRQSDRIELYQAAVERLKNDGFLYPCFESEEELKAKQEFRRKRGQPLIYDRAMLKLTAKQRQDAEAGGKRPHWRFRLSGRTLEWRDTILGPRQASLATVSDPIVARADGTPTAIIASVVDDLDFKTTHIVRGDDAAGNTAVQIELLEVLGGAASGMRFAHLPALTDSATPGAGGRRVGSLSLRSLKADGFEPAAIAACMVSSKGDDALVQPVDDLAAKFELSSMAVARFDMTRMLAANRRALSALDFAAVADRLPDGATEAFWLAVRGDLDLLKEARGWWDVVAGSIVPPAMDGHRDIVQAAARVLPPEPWDQSVWPRWIAAVEQATGQTGDSVSIPLCLALTGEETGPGLAALLPLIGRARTAGRLRIAGA
jgi:glutamyl-tRNA synthetase